MKCNPEDNLPNDETLLSTTSLAETVQPNNSLPLKDSIKELSVPNDGENIVKTGNIENSPPDTLPAEIIQLSELELSSKKSGPLLHSQSAALNKSDHKTQAVGSQKAKTLDFRSSPPDQKFSKKLKTLKSKPDLLTGDAVTPLGAFSTFEWDPSCLLEELYIDCKPISPPGIQPSRLVVEEAILLHYLWKPVLL